jgi:hypothetical protein
VRDIQTTAKLKSGLDQIILLTKSGKLHWERQLGSAHRYAKLNDNLLILGPAESPQSSAIPRYLFITPFNSPDFIEVNSADQELGDRVLDLVSAVEIATKDQPPTDPFSLDTDFLNGLNR